MIHELRSWPKYFQDTLDGVRTYDLRRDDRGFQVGDELLLREYRPECPALDGVESGYTGRTHRVRIVHMMRASEFSGLAPRYVVLGLELRSCLTCDHARKHGSVWCVREAAEVVQPWGCDLWSARRLPGE